MRIALFATCLIDSFRPSAGFAVIKLLEQAGYQVDVPELQTCCGQPAYNNGDLQDARKIAQQTIETFNNYKYVIIPSGSCAGMLIQHYPKLFEDNPEWQSKATDLSRRCYELTNFLYDVAKKTSFPVKHKGSITYHDSCSSLRETGSKQQARNLISSNKNLNLIELEDSETCCGFGGTFCVKYPEISEQMVNDKVANIIATGAEILVSADLGCLLNIAGRLKRLNKPIKVFHIAELLAGETDQAGIGDVIDKSVDSKTADRK
ncbi:MAG: (Fe-S)-binding protein [Gammaproteobacteria bacterium]|nr:(Fe-S)-binding protein [Gammaproteobacteria bacterium]